MHILIASAILTFAVLFAFLPVRDRESEKLWPILRRYLRAPLETRIALIILAVIIVLSVLYNDGTSKYAVHYNTLFEGVANTYRDSILIVIGILVGSLSLRFLYLLIANGDPGATPKSAIRRVNESAYVFSIVSLLLAGASISELPGLLRKISVTITGDGLTLGLRESDSFGLISVPPELLNTQTTNNDDYSSHFSIQRSRFERDYNYVCEIVNYVREISREEEKYNECEDNNSIELKIFRSYRKDIEASIIHFIECTASIIQTTGAKQIVSSVFSEGAFLLLDLNSIPADRGVTNIPNHDATTGSRDITKFSDRAAIQWRVIQYFSTFSEKVPEFVRNSSDCTEAKRISDELRGEIESLRIKKRNESCSTRISMEKHSYADFDNHFIDGEYPNIARLCRLFWDGPVLPYGELLFADFALLSGDISAAVSHLDRWIARRQEQLRNPDPPNYEKSYRAVHYYLLYLASYYRNYYISLAEINPHDELLMRQSYFGVDDLFISVTSNAVSLDRFTGETCLFENFNYLNRLVAVHAMEENNILFIALRNAETIRDDDDFIRYYRDVIMQDRMSDIANLLTALNKDDKCLRDSVRVTDSNESLTDFLRALASHTLAMLETVRVRRAAIELPYTTNSEAVRRAHERAFELAVSALVALKKIHPECSDHRSWTSRDDADHGSKKWTTWRGRQANVYLDYVCDQIVSRKKWLKTQLGAI